MINNLSDAQNQHNPNKFILPTLFISIFSSATPDILTGLLLIDIGQTFISPIGVIGQIRTLSPGIAVVTALLTGIFSVRFRHKSVLIYGLVLLAISSLGCGLAVNIGMMFIVFSISGFGRAMVVPMATTLIAEHFPLKRRSNAMGWLIAGGSLSYLVGSPVISFLGEVAGWRYAFLAYSLPLLLLGIILAYKGLP
ncbi:MFS transporter, partial [Thermoproteota archaeon]